MPAQDAAPAADYAELHAHTNFSLLDGASSPEEMVEEAVICKLRALAITDHDSLSGVVRFAAAARRHDLRAIVGVELTLDTPPETAHVVLLAQNLAGYRNICALLSEACDRGARPPGGAVRPPRRRRRRPDRPLRLPPGRAPRARAAPDAAAVVARRYRDAFGADRYFVEVSHHALQADGPRNAGLRAVAAELGLGLVATNDAHYHDRKRRRAAAGGHLHPAPHDARGRRGAGGPPPGHPARQRRVRPAQRGGHGLLLPRPGRAGGRRGGAPSSTPCAAASPSPSAAASA